MKKKKKTRHNKKKQVTKTCQSPYKSLVMEKLYGIHWTKFLFNSLFISWGLHTARDK
jgi:hypothetical protein